jgi:hypothetical protein
MATEENLKSKRSPVKSDVMHTAVQGAQRPTGRPTQHYLENLFGAPLDARQLSALKEGVFDDDPEKTPWSDADLRMIDRCNLDYERMSEMRSRQLAFAAKQRAAREAARLAAQKPEEYTCLDCKQEFEHLRRITVKICVDCAEQRHIAADKKFRQEEAARLAAERQEAKEQEKVWTPEETLAALADWRVEFGKAARRVKRIPTINAMLDSIRRRRNVIPCWNNSPAAKKQRQLLDWHERYLRDLGDHYEARLTYTADGYESMLGFVQQDREQAGEFPKFRYCLHDGFEIPWAEQSFFCDDECERKIDARGNVHFDMGESCGACGARLIGPDATSETIAALPRVGGKIMHTRACLMSQRIDPADYAAFGPDADCWKPILHVAGIKPAWSYKERAVLALPTLSATMAALPRRPVAVLPQFIETLDQSDDRRMVEWATRLKGSYFDLGQARVGTGKGWIATARIRRTIDRLVSDGKFVAHPGLKNRWRIAEQNENR